MTVEQLRLEQKRINLTNSELKLEYFKTHFKIIQKNFRAEQYQMNAEAFFIRMKRPKLNKQEELSFFQLFWNRLPVFGMSYFWFDMPVFFYTQHDAPGNKRGN